MKKKYKIELTKEQLLECFNDGTNLVEYIDNPSKNIIHEALKSNPFHIEKLDNQTNKMQKIVVDAVIDGQWDESVLSKLKNPQQNIIKKILSWDVYLYRHIRKYIKDVNIKYMFKNLSYRSIENIINTGEFRVCKSTFESINLFEFLDYIKYKFR